MVFEAVGEGRPEFDAPHPPLLLGSYPTPAVALDLPDERSRHIPGWCRRGPLAGDLAVIKFDQPVGAREIAVVVGYHEHRLVP